MSKSKSRNSIQKQELKSKLISKHGCVCKLCLKRFSLNLLTLDHIMPLALGGTWAIHNLQLACYPCNQEKGDTYIDPWSML